MRYLIPNAVGLAILGLGPVLRCAPTGLGVFHQELIDSSSTLAVRHPNTGSGEDAASLGSLTPRQTIPGFIQQPLANAKERGYDWDAVDWGDPIVGTLYKVTHPAYENGEDAVDEIGVESEAGTVAICDSKNDDDKKVNDKALSLSEITMNVWVDTSGGQNPVEIKTIYLQNVVEKTTAPVIREGNELFKSWTWTIPNDGTASLQAQLIFQKLTRGSRLVGTKFGGAVQKMNRNWIGKTVTSLDVKDMSVTYHLG